MSGVYGTYKPIKIYSNNLMKILKNTFKPSIEKPKSLVGEITLSDQRGGVVCDRCGGQVNEWKHTYRKDLVGALTVVGSVCLECDKND